jgi:serine/threonine-protein kinase
VAIPVVGGIPRTLSDSAGCCVRWQDDGNVYFSSASFTDIFRVPATGGEVELVVSGSAESNWLGEAQPIPGSDRLLFTRCCNPGRIEVLDPASGETEVVTLGTKPHLIGSGHLVFTSEEGQIMAAGFDPGSGQLTGSAVPMVDEVSLAGGVSYPLMSVADDGTLVYLTGLNTVNARAEFVWVERSGAAVPVDPGWTFDQGDVNRGWRLSPDDSQLAFRGAVDGAQDIWIKQLPAGPLSRLTFHDAIDRMPRWSPDGEYVTFISNRNEGFDVWWKPADGTGQAELLFDHEEDLSQGFLSPDGEWVIMRVSGFEAQEGLRDLLAARVGEDSATPLAADETYHESAPAVSRDGRWLAYQSNETGDWEIFVRPFPDVDSGRWQVSTNGGYSPLWANSGRELFYIDASNNLVVVEVETEPQLRTSSPEILFSLPSDFLVGTVAGQIDITSDDQRFVMARIATSGTDEVTTDPELILVQNWVQELNERVGN